ncbi:sigma-54 interaction domain-containing protein [Alkaliphilus peptidifermentans]|uniref:Arginine utilization regulatory protein n=1 Tax=Alkaliphilus peptidifermentans DSM 18978 TaxID=1120976 RepID=A0A1G5GZJ0_9FIRM|nr:sigma 54-interacting transcriptional regulator [Alkaliphilus peptidifermentans]SCY56904.1 arginine utilization regulatory protein [Alkaliphilus peptidifermentans DSM 18978]
MQSKKIIMVILQKILQSIDEGVHVLDNEGKTILYNEAMADLEGMETEDVMDKDLLEVFTTLNHETSTLLRVLKTEKPIYNQSQTYLNNKGKKITTINTTIPLYYMNDKIGALEIAKNITKMQSLSEEIMRLQQQLIPNKATKSGEIKKYTFEDLKGRSQSFYDALKVARRAANTSSSVLIYGETGTGKELFAQSIHYQSPRRNKPFIAQNCAALPESLLEGILFGTTKGSFTGAIDRPGLFEQANGGTILLDEINSMGLQLQVKLLRVLQEGYVRRIGGLKDVPIDVRIIATTNEPPMETIEGGQLRKDLYYRLNVVNIHIPALRDRKDDILFLTEFFINKYNHQLDKDVWMLSESMQKHFNNYMWPGNIRELENLIEGAMNIIQDEHILKEEHFPHYIFEHTNKREPQVRGFIDTAEMGLNEMLETVEQQLIEGSLKRFNGNISKAASNLGIKRQTLQHKLKKYKL